MLDPGPSGVFSLLSLASCSVSCTPDQNESVLHEVNDGVLSAA